VVCQSVTLRKGYRLRLLTEEVLRKTFGRKRNAVVGDWRKLHIERLRALYYTQSIIQTKKSEVGLACTTYAGEKSCVQGLVGKPEVKKLLGESRYV
jgi:hypothetical protein